MNAITEGLTKPTATARDDFSHLYSLFVLSMLMFSERHEETILGLALSSVPALGTCRADAGYLVRNGKLAQSPPTSKRRREFEPQLDALNGADGVVTSRDSPWGWAYALRNRGGLHGYIVLSSACEPSSDEVFLLKVLAQQTAAALANASLHRAERDYAQQLRRLSAERTVMNARLSAALADLESQRKIHEVLTTVSARGQGESGIAGALNELTGLAVAVEDRFGNLRAWAGPNLPDPYPKPEERERAEMLRLAASEGSPIRHKEHLITLAQPRTGILGVLVLIDPDRTAGPLEVFALEHAATVEAMELAHLGSLAEAELRLRRELVEELLTGSDEQSAHARAEAVGHDLSGVHHVAVVQWQNLVTDEVLERRVKGAVDRLGMSSLVAKRSGGLVLLIRGRPDGAALYKAISQEAGSTNVTIGIGRRCESPGDFSRSLWEATQAFDVRRNSPLPNGSMTFDELGIYRLFGSDERGRAEVQHHIRQWLGPLVDYDSTRHSDLLRTLSEYLECGGKYDTTAAALLIHRSTLRYRLKRIRELTGLDLGDADCRLNLHVATRAWRSLYGPL